MACDYHACMNASSQPASTPISPATDDAAFDPPESIAPGPKLSATGFFVALAFVCLVPLSILTVYAVVNGKATEKTLPVIVNIDHRPMQVPDGQAPKLEEVISIENEADFAISSLYVDLNGQFFMYVDQPLAVGETLVLPQAWFVNRSGQRWVPGNFRINTITVMGKLPSGARGVSEFDY